MSSLTPVILNYKQNGAVISIKDENCGKKVFIYTIIYVTDMNLSWLFVLVAVAVICNVAGSSILMESDLPTKKCRYLTSYDLFHALCKDLKLNDVPKNLQSSIEVRSLSFLFCNVLKIY